MRTLRRIVDVGLPILGILVVFAAVLLAIGLYTQLLLVTIGILIIEAGIWKLANPLLPSERRYLLLRREVDRFVPLVRRMNRAAVAVRAGAPGAQTEYAAALAAMHDAVESMGQVAGVEGDVAPAGSAVNR